MKDPFTSPAQIAPANDVVVTLNIHIFYRQPSAEQVQRTALDDEIDRLNRHLARFYGPEEVAS
ncbi:hypothetical protein [Kordiimonas sp.]|uniref:hypothetical protein n=1 Tax=Kordiimonas sp. TaxID=1970157 RepID=UPI003A8E59B2